MKTLRHIALSAVLCAAALCAQARPSILTLADAAADSTVVFPESVETDVNRMMQNWYLQNYTALDKEVDNRPDVATTDAELIERLQAIPTTIEMPFNSVVRQYIDMYTGRKRSLVESMLGMSLYYMPIFEQAIEKEGIPIELKYLPVIESAMNPDAVSRAGAVGLWQIMLPTARGLGLEINTLVDERRDPVRSSEAAARYLRELYDIYKDWSLAIAAYNCGPGNVNKALRRAGAEPGVKKDFWDIYNFLPQETRGYVPAFIAANYVMNYYREHGITPTVVKRQLTTDTVMVKNYVHFNQISSVLNIPVDEIRMLNPQFRKDIIPGDYRPYALTLPTQQCLSYVMSEKHILDYDRDLYARRSYAEPGGETEVPAAYAASDGGQANMALASRQSSNAEVNNEIAQTLTERMVVKTHTVGRGESIRDIARQYGVSATDIKRWNKLRRGKVKEGDRLTIEVVERVTPDEVRVVAAQEVAQVDPSSFGSSDPQTEAAAAVVAATAASAAKAKAVTEKKAAPAKAKATETKAKPRTTTYKVKSGDTLERIAKRHGTTVSAIQAANGMGKKTGLQIGQVLKIPAKATVSKSTRKSTAKNARKRPAKRRR